MQRKFLTPRGKRFAGLSFAVEALLKANMREQLRLAFDAERLHFYDDSSGNAIRPFKACRSGERPPNSLSGSDNLSWVVFFWFYLRHSLCVHGASRATTQD
jgi:hypothetical protein